MVFKNLFRRKGRTILTVVGISIGMAAIVALGAVARGMQAGLTAMAQGSQADLVLTQGGAASVVLGSVDEAIADELRRWPEIADVDGVLFSNALLGDLTYLFIFGHDPQGFSVDHFRIVEGQELARARETRGKPLILGRRAAENLSLGVGDALRFSNSTFRVVGVYETGDGFEDRGAVVPLVEAQGLALQPRRVSMLYIQLDDPAGADQVRARVERRFPDLVLSTSSEFVDQEQMFEVLEAVAMGVAGLAVAIGGIVMTNTLFMSVFERTREIGLLRSLGWRRRRVLCLILGESMSLSLLGGVAGMGLGVAATYVFGQSGSWLSALGSHFTPGLFVRALVTVIVLGLVGGAYPAWWASRLLPQEALGYEGGGSARAPRVRGGMVMRNLLRQRTRTALTLLGIGVSISAIVALGALVEGSTHLMAELWRRSETDLVAIQANVDSDLSAIDQRVGARIAVRPDVEAVSGMILTGANTEENPMLLVFGYHPREFAIRHFHVVEGEPLSGSRQVLVGRRAAEEMGLVVGDTFRLMNSRFRVAGIYETGLAYEEIGVVISLREAQALTGKPHQVWMYAIKLRDPARAEAVRDELEEVFADVDFSLTADAAEHMSDLRVLQDMVSQISFLAILIGAMGMLNTMSMSVLERTREIGVLRALGWRRRRVLGMILRESLALGAVGGLFGALLGTGLSGLMNYVPGLLGSTKPVYTLGLFVQAAVVALVAGVTGGLYPAWRATRMRPIEALRYE